MNDEFEIQPRTIDEIRSDASHLEKSIRAFTLIAWILITIGLAVLCPGLFSFFQGSIKLNELGDYLAGTTGIFFSLAAIMFIYVAFLAQRLGLIYQGQELRAQQLELQSTREVMTKQAFENTFFHIYDALFEIRARMKLTHSPGAYFRKSDTPIVRVTEEGPDAIKYIIETLSEKYIHHQGKGTLTKEKKASLVEDLFKRRGHIISPFLAQLENCINYAFTNPGCGEHFYVDLILDRLSEIEIVFVAIAVTGSQRYQRLSSTLEALDVFKRLSEENKVFIVEFGHPPSSVGLQIEPIFKVAEPSET